MGDLFRQLTSPKTGDSWYALLLSSSLRRTRSGDKCPPFFLFLLVVAEGGLGEVAAPSSLPSSCRRQRTKGALNATNNAAATVNILSSSYRLPPVRFEVTDRRRFFRYSKVLAVWMAATYCFFRTSTVEMVLRTSPLTPGPFCGRIARHTKPPWRLSSGLHQARRIQTIDASRHIMHTWDTLPLSGPSRTESSTSYSGINPGLRSAAVGHHYAGYSNRLLELLCDGPDCRNPLTYHDDERLLEWGLGLTNLVAAPDCGWNISPPKTMRQASESDGKNSSISPALDRACRHHALSHPLPLEPKQAGRKPGLQIGDAVSIPVSTLLPQSSGRNAAYPYHAFDVPYAHRGAGLLRISSP